MSAEYVEELHCLSESLAEIFRSVGGEKSVLRRGGGTYGCSLGMSSGVPFSHCPRTPRFAVKVNRLATLLRRRDGFSSARSHAHLLLDFRRHVTRVEEVADRERSALNSHRLRNTAPPTSSRGRTGSTDNVGYRYGIEHLGDFCDVYRRHVASWQALSTASAATGSDGSPDFRTLLSNMRREHFALSEKCVRRLVDLARVGFACFAHRLHGDVAAITTAGVANNGGDSELWRVLRAVRELNTLLASSGRWRHPQTLTLTRTAELAGRREVSLPMRRHLPAVRRPTGTSHRRRQQASVEPLRTYAYDDDARHAEIRELAETLVGYERLPVGL